MQNIQLEKQEAQSIDDATRAAIAQARAEIERGEGLTLEQAVVVLEKQRQIWRKNQQEVLAA